MTDVVVTTAGVLAVTDVVVTTAGVLDAENPPLPPADADGSQAPQAAPRRNMRLVA